MWRDSLAQPEGGTKVDVDHVPERVRRSGERIPGLERTYGVDEHLRRPDFTREGLEAIYLKRR